MQAEQIVATGQADVVIVAGKCFETLTGLSTRRERFGRMSPGRRNT
jgi:hypothetical protein